MLFRQKQEFGSAVREHQKIARSAINDAVMRSSERYQAAMFQLIQNAQNRCEGQVENNERQIAMEIWNASARSSGWPKTPFASRTAVARARWRKRERFPDKISEVPNSISKILFRQNYQRTKCST